MADIITYAPTVQAIQAYAYDTAQIAKMWATNGGPAAEIAAYRQFPDWSVMPRLPDGQLLSDGQVQVDTSGAGSVALAAGGQDALLAVVGGGTATLTGGSGGTDILLADVANGGPTTLNAGSGNDYLYGGAGNNTFVDNTGSNYMQGGTGANTFTFADAHSGHDIIGNFHIGTDVLNIAANLNGNGIITALELIASATVGNGNTVLHLSGNDDITMIGITNPSSLLASIAIL